jgi:hypothetical protein
MFRGSDCQIWTFKRLFVTSQMLATGSSMSLKKPFLRVYLIFWAIFLMQESNNHGYNRSDSYRWGNDCAKGSGKLWTRQLGAMFCPISKFLAELNSDAVLTSGRSRNCFPLFVLFWLWVGESKCSNRNVVCCLLMSR